MATCKKCNTYLKPEDVQNMQDCPKCGYWERVPFEPEGTKWTPGPWEIDSSHVRTAVNAGDTHVAMVNWGITLEAIKSAISEEEHKANANLIAAAPDLYEALRNIENDDGSIPATIWKMAQDAIAKAEGRGKE